MHLRGVNFYYSTDLSDSAILIFFNLKCISRLTIIANIIVIAAAIIKLKGSSYVLNVMVSISIIPTTA